MDYYGLQLPRTGHRNLPGPSAVSSSRKEPLPQRQGWSSFQEPVTPVQPGVSLYLPQNANSPGPCVAEPFE